MRIPLEISEEVNVVNKLQSSTIVITNDAVSSQTSTPGVEPEYGTFDWVEFAGARPVAVSSRYYWQKQTLFRVLTWDGSASAPHLVIEGVEQYGDIVFKHTPSNWQFHSDANDWVYTRGGIAVDLSIKKQSTGESSELLNHASVVANFRPTFERSVPFPSPLW